MLQFLSLLLLPLFFISSLSLQALAPSSSTDNVASLTFEHEEDEEHGETGENEDHGETGEDEGNYSRSYNSSYEYPPPSPHSLSNSYPSPHFDHSSNSYLPPRLTPEGGEQNTPLLPTSYAVKPTLAPVWLILTLVAIVFFILSLPAFGYLTATFLQAENTLTTLDYLPLLAPSATIFLSSIFISIFATLFVRSLEKNKKAKLQYTPYNPTSYNQTPNTPSTNEPSTAQRLASEIMSLLHAAPIPNEKEEEEEDLEEEDLEEEDPAPTDPWQRYSGKYAGDRSLQTMFSVLDPENCELFDLLASEFPTKMRLLCKYLNFVRVNDVLKEALETYSHDELKNNLLPILNEFNEALIDTLELSHDLEDLPDSQLEVLVQILTHPDAPNDFHDFFLENSAEEGFADFLERILPKNMEAYNPSSIKLYCRTIASFATFDRTKAMPLFRSAILPATYHLNSIKSRQYTPIAVDPEKFETFTTELAHYAQTSLRPLLAPLYPNTTATTNTITIKPVKELRHNGKLVLATNQPQADGSINIQVSYAFCQLYYSLEKKDPVTAKAFKIFILANELHQALHQISTQSQTTTPLSDDEIEYLSMIASLQTLCSVPSFRGQTFNPVSLINILKSLLDNSLIPIHSGESPKLSTQELELVKHIEKHLGIIHQNRLTTSCSLLNVKALCTKGSSDSLATAVHLTSIVLSSS